MRLARMMEQTFAKLQKRRVTIGLTTSLKSERLHQNKTDGASGTVVGLGACPANPVYSDLRVVGNGVVMSGAEGLNCRAQKFTVQRSH